MGGAEGRSRGVHRGMFGKALLNNVLTREACTDVIQMPPSMA